MKPEKKYYCNQECFVLSYFEDKAVIEIAIGENTYSDDWDEPSYTEPYETQIIVPVALLSDSYISLEEEQNNRLKEANDQACIIKKEAEDILHKAKKEASDIKSEAEKDIKRVEKKALSLNGLEPFIDYLNGDINYVIKFSRWNRSNPTRFDALLYTKEEFETATGKDYDSRELQAFFFRRTKDRGKIQIVLNSYSDYSGEEKYELEFFKTLEDMQNYVYKCLSKCVEISTQNTYEHLLKYGFEHTLMDKFIEDKFRAEEKMVTKEFEKITRAMAGYKEQQEALEKRRQDLLLKKGNHGN